ncbi:MAG: hypothetical protein ACKN9E_13495 [Microcystaceae cyanobacterium]|nr:hypothetical protein [Merismopediaceae bacterium]
MSYSFDVLGVTPIFTFFTYQQEIEQNPQRSIAYLGSHCCSLDGFIQATEQVLKKPDWDWDAVVQSMIDFWLRHESQVKQWKQELQYLGRDNLLVGRVANVEALRQEFETLL